MEFEPTRLPEVLLIKPRVFGDERGFFLESWNEQRICARGIAAHFVTGQSQPFESSYPARLALPVPTATREARAREPRRGVRCGRGCAAQLTALRSVGRGASARHRITISLWVPPGFAHGYLALTDEVDFLYKCTDFYAPQHERSFDGMTRHWLSSGRCRPGPNHSYPAVIRLRLRLKMPSEDHCRGIEAGTRAGHYARGLQDRRNARDARTFSQCACFARPSSTHCTRM